MFAFAALLGCENDLPNGPSDEQHNLISFGQVSTRVVDSVSDIEEFPVWACMADPSANLYAPILTGERVYRNPEGSDTWTYDNTRLWIDDSHFFFLGVFSDAETYPRFVENKYDLEGNGSQYVIYTMGVTTPATADLDILTAFNYTNTSGEYNKTVSMQFSHLLTKVNLKIRQDFEKDPDFDYFVTKVTISGLKNSGTYMFMPFAAEKPYYWDNWEFVDSTLSIDKTLSTPEILRAYGTADPKNKTVNIWGDAGLMLIPQEIAANGVKIRVDYLYDITPGDGDPGTTSHYVEGFLPADPNPEESILWQSGKSINYTLKIAEQNDITFAQPTIEPWGAPQTGGTIIIK